MKLKKDRTPEVLRASKLHTDLFTLVLSGQNQIIARLDALMKGQRELLKFAGVADSDKLVKNAFATSFGALEKGLKESVAKIQQALPDADTPEGNENN